MEDAAGPSNGFALQLRHPDRRGYRGSHWPEISRQARKRVPTAASACYAVRSSEQPAPAGRAQGPAPPDLLRQSDGPALAKLPAPRCKPTSRTEAEPKPERAGGNRLEARMQNGSREALELTATKPPQQLQNRPVRITGSRFSCAAAMVVASSAHKSTPRQLLALVMRGRFLLRQEPSAHNLGLEISTASAAADDD